MGAPATELLGAIRAGDPGAAERLLPLVYEDLRALAAQRMSHEAAGHTLNATCLVHEAYLRLVGDEGDGPIWSGRAHFFAAAAEAMRRILIDHARAKNAGKRGGGRRKLSLDDASLALDGASEDLLDLDASLTRLRAEDPRKADLVQLRFFGGLTLEQAAMVLGVSPATADRDWAYARAWLYSDLTERRERLRDDAPGDVSPH